MRTNPLKSTSGQSSYEGAYDLTYSFNEYWFGLYPEHEGITLPPGEYDLEIEVTGGITFSAAGAKAVGFPSGPMYIGPGGVPQPPPPYRYSAGGDRLFQVNVIREHLNNGQRVRREIWTAPFMEPVRAGGKVRVQGGARFFFTRYSVASWPLWPQDAISRLLWQGYHPSEIWVSNQTGRLVAKPVAELALECAGNLGPGRVTRGESVTCVAKSDDPNFQVTQWSFASTGGRYTITPLDPAQNSRREWPGEMVVGGTVTVNARVSGRPETATARITVEDRDWGDRTPHFSFVEAVEGDQRMALPDEVYWASDLGFANFFMNESDAAVTPDFTVPVASGPNDGLSYFGDEATIRVFGYYRLNYGAMQRGSRFYAAQEQRATGIWCPQSVVVTQLPRLVELHERMHGTAYEAGLLRVFPQEIALLERTVSSNVGDLYDAYDESWERIDLVARAESESIHGKPGGLLAPSYQGRPCALKNERGMLLPNKP